MVAVWVTQKPVLMLKGANPGELDKRATLQVRTVAANAYNEPVETWAELATVWTKVEYPKTGSEEAFEDNINIAATRVDFTIRYRTDVGFVERILYESEVYDIERIAELGRRDYLKITGKRRL